MNLKYYLNLENILFYFFRFPRNRTVTDYNWEEQCEEREVVRQDCRTEYETRNRTVTTQKCNQYFEEVCANYTVPQYEVVSTHTHSPQPTVW